MFIDELLQRMRGRDIELDVDPAVIEKLSRDGFDPVYGARPLRREVEHQVENPLAMKIVKGECPDGSRVQVSLKDREIDFRVIGQA